MRANAIALMLALAGCEAQPDAPITELATADPATPAEPAAPASGWTIDESGGAPMLVLSDAQGATAMTMRCSGDPAQFEVRVAGFTPIASEERLSLGLGETIVTMVADPGDMSGGVVATTHDPAAVVAPLRVGGEIVVSYGASNFGPVPTPGADEIEMLGRSCG